jgi:hypothetical protein
MSAAMAVAKALGLMPGESPSRKVVGMGRRHGTGLLQDAREGSPAWRRDLQDEDRRREVGRKLAGDRSDCLRTTGQDPNHDDEVMPGHWTSVRQELATRRPPERPGCSL